MAHPLTVAEYPTSVLPARLGAGGDGAAGPVPMGDGAPVVRMERRIANLDLLRAAAITLVVLVNAVGEGLIDGGTWVNHVLESGWVGVDLFFVLSGWLIGGLYWREHERFGSVQIGRFWARRWLRTIPPYLVAFIAVAGVRVVMGMGDDPWSWLRYLTFTQNLSWPMPFWGVSWSLAVEEHFYLALPLALGLGLRMRGGVPFLLTVAVLTPFVLRMALVPDGASPWGVNYTATPFRMEGLALGVAASYVRWQRPDLWPRLRRGAVWLVVPALAVIASVPWLPVDVLNHIAYTAVDLSFTVVLIAVVDRRALPFAASRAVRWIALTSYSVYMMHTLVFDLVGRTPLSRLPAVLRVLVAVAAVGAVGAAFYLAIERPSLWLRHRWAPRRPELPSSPLAPSGAS